MGLPHRAVTERGETINFYLSATCNEKAAKRFLSEALLPFRNYELLAVITTDEAGCARPVLFLEEESSTERTKPRGHSNFQQITTF